MSDTMLLSTPNRRGSGAFKWDLAGEQEIPMWVADMDFAVAPEITDALRRRIEHPVFGYAGVPRSYLEAVCEWEAARNAWTLDPHDLVVVPSVMPAIAVAIQELTRPGDRIATFSPVYFPFFETIRKLGREVVRVPLAETEDADGQRSYAIDADALEAALGRSSLFLLCSPHNPGGRVWRHEELATVRDSAARVGVPVVSDEIHSDLIFPHGRFIPWLTVGPATDHDIALVAPSKTFNIPGLPTATAVIPHRAWRKEYLAAMKARKLDLPNVLAMTAAEAAYRHAGDWLDTVCTTVRDHYEVLRSRMIALEGVSVHRMEGTFIAWLDLRRRWKVTGPAPAPISEPPRNATSDADVDGGSVSERFGAVARQHGVWLSDGRSFGPEGEGFMRMNIATSRENLEAGIGRVAAALDAFDAEL